VSGAIREAEAHAKEVAVWLNVKEVAVWLNVKEVAVWLNVSGMIQEEGDSVVGRNMQETL
jgi:hypothetical protein